jgi:hypothetical protein
LRPAAAPRARACVLVDDQTRARHSATVLPAARGVPENATVRREFDVCIRCDAYLDSCSFCICSYLLIFFIVLYK